MKRELKDESLIPKKTIVLAAAQIPMKRELKVNSTPRRNNVQSMLQPKSL